MRLELSLKVVLHETVWSILGWCRRVVLIRIASEEGPTSDIEVCCRIVHLMLRAGRGSAHKRVLVALLYDRETTIIDAETRLLQTRIVVIVSVWHGLFVIVLNGEETLLLLTKRVISKLAWALLGVCYDVRSHRSWLSHGLYHIGLLA